DSQYQKQPYPEPSLLDQWNCFASDVQAYADAFPYYPQNRDYATGSDNIWLVVENEDFVTAPAIVQYLDRRVALNDVKRWSHNLAVTFGGRMFKRLVRNQWLFGRPYWEDVTSQFDIDNHVFLRKLAAPGGEKELKDLVGEIASTPLDFRWPLWQVFCVQGFVDKNGKERTVVISRIHHSVADGAGTMTSLFKYVKALDPATGLADPSKAASHVGPPIIVGLKMDGDVKLLEAKEPGIERLLQTGLAVFVGLMLYLSHVIHLILFELPLFFKRGMRSKDSLLFRRHLPKQVGWTNRIQFERIKKVKRALGMTVNDVMVGCFNAALAKYLESLKTSRNVDPYFVWFVPASFRNPSNSKDWSLNNVSTGFLLSVSSGHKSVIEFTRDVCRQMSMLKKSVEPYLVYFVMEYGFLFPWCFPRWAVLLGTHMIHGGISNVPGPKDPISFGTASVERINFAIMSAPGTIFALVSSYGSDMFVAVQTDVDSEAEKDCFEPGMADAVCKLFEEEFEKLEELCKGGSALAPSPISVRRVWSHLRRGMIILFILLLFLLPFIALQFV
ncbi:hypothetical protein M427DRAFT_262885, partial [Gonapodya prolifera JEL478]